MCVLRDKKYSTCFVLHRDPEMISITSAPEAPPPRIRIVDSRGREVETVRIGDKLTFRIEIPDDSKYSLVFQALLRSLEMSLLLY